MIGWIRAVLLSATVLLAAGCTGGPASTPTSSSTPSVAEQLAVDNAVPEAQRPKATSFAGFRALDPCALHNPDAAKTVSGDQVDELLPSTDGLNECVLRLTQGDFAGTWTLYLEVGADYDSSRRRFAAPETIGGRLIYREETDDKTGCDFARPLDDTSAIVLRVRNYNRSSENKPTKTPCDLGREYVQATATSWADPPRRDRELTSPMLTLAALDPCQGAVGLLEEYGDGAELHPMTPFKCGARAGFGSGGKGKPKEKSAQEEVTVSYTVEEQPLKLVGQKTNGIDHIALTVAGRNAVAAASKSGCRIAVVWDEKTWMVADAKAENAPKTYEVIVIQTKTCDIAQATADKVLAKAGQR